MHDYPGETSGWARLVRALSASFRVGRFFGVEVRLFWLAVVVLPLFSWIEMARWDLAGPELVFRVAFFTVALLVLVWTHEMGHILAARRYGVFTPLITISPLGGLAHLSTGVPSPRADVVVSLAGPATHLLQLAVLWPLTRLIGDGWLRPEGWWQGAPSIAVEQLFHMNLVLMLFNLLPVFPLDGGRVLRALLTFRMNANRATRISARVGQVGGVALVVYGLFQEGLWASILVVIGITVFLACMQEIRAARYHAGPYAAAAREPWEDDPDAWRRPARGGEGGAAKPGFFARLGARRRAARASRERAAAADLAAQVDRVLDRLNEVGLDGLTREERRVLERASKVRRE